jgi:dolichol kinase
MKEETRHRGVGLLLTILLASAVVWFLGFRFVFTTKMVARALQTLGVALKRVGRTTKELKRKTFHLFGLVIPSLLFFGIKYPLSPSLLSRRTAVIAMGATTLLYWTLELGRVLSPTYRALFEKAFGAVMRAKEKDSFTGMGFYLLGNFVCIACFPPLIAIAAARKS